MAEEIILTDEGREKVKQELEHLKTVGRAQIAERIRRARAQGDLSENFEYHEAKRAQAMLEGRIRELQRILEVADRTDHLPGEDGVVAVGGVVTVEDLEHREKWKFRIVDTASAAVFGADEEYEHVSAASPLGQALVGKKVGDIVQVQTPGGTVDYEILSVHT